MGSGAESREPFPPPRNGAPRRARLNLSASWSLPSARGALVRSDFVMGGVGSPFSIVAFVIVVVVLVASWVILASSRFVQGGIVERPERVPQLYGYTVCLVALVVGLASLTSLV